MYLLILAAQIERFVRSKLEVCRWVGLAVLLVQLISLGLAYMLSSAQQKLLEVRWEPSAASRCQEGACHGMHLCSMQELLPLDWSLVQLVCKATIRIIVFARSIWCPMRFLVQTTPSMGAVSTFARIPCNCRCTPRRKSSIVDMALFGNAAQR